MTKLKKYGTESALHLLLDEAVLDAPEGRVADYIPELRQADANDSGISICYLDGTTLSAGSCDKRFTIQSISKAVVRKNSIGTIVLPVTRYYVPY